MTITLHRNNATHAVHVRLSGGEWVKRSSYRGAKKAARAAAKFLGRGYTARVVAL